MISSAIELRYHVYKEPKEIPALCKKLLTHRVYEETGTLQSKYVRFINGTDKRCVSSFFVVAFHGPIAVAAVIWEKNTSTVETIVKPEYRRRGVGTVLYRILRSLPEVENRVLTGVPGFPGWEHFFRTNWIFEQDLETPGDEEKALFEEWKASGYSPSLVSKYHKGIIRLRRASFRKRYNLYLKLKSAYKEDIVK